MNLRVCSGILALAAISLNAHAALMQVSLEGALFSGSAVQLGYRFQGLSGDVIEVPNGSHEVSVVSTNEYRFIIGIKVTPDGIAIESTRYEPPNCQQPRNVTWKRSEILAPDKSGITKIIVPEPVFGATSGMASCVQASMGSCNSRKTILRATSNPKSAEIWIDGKKLESKTDATLSIPFCTDERSKMLVYRLAGRVNCERKFDLAADAVVNGACELTPIATAAK